MLLAVVFAVAGVAKVFGWAEFHQAVAAFGIPAKLVVPIGLVLPGLELATAVLLMSAPWAWWGAAMAALLLGTFTLAITVNLAKGRQPDCRCFGQIHSRPIGPLTLGRNIVLGACAAMILVAPADGLRVGVLNGLAGVSGVPVIVVALGLAALVVLTAQTCFLWQLFRQQGRLLVRLDALEDRLGIGPVPFVADTPEEQGLPVGTPAPALEAAGASRQTTRLEALLGGGREALLIFSDVNCGPCAMLLPEIRQWQREHADDMRIALVSRGSEDENRLIAERYDLADVLCQEDGEVSDAYQIPGTPTGVLVRADGTIGAPIAMGRNAIAELLKLHVGVTQHQ